MKTFIGVLGLLTWSNTIVIAAPVPATYVAQTTTGGGINRPVLKVGSTGTPVSELQAALKLLGYYKGAVDGVYTEKMAIAVSQFQQVAKLNADGIVNAQTWEKLFPRVTSSSPKPAASKITAARFPTPAGIKKGQGTALPVQSSALPTILKLGMRGAAVTQLQKRLQAIGVFKGAVDGVFGRKTESAVKAAQRRYRLQSDGVVGAATWKVLRQSAAKR